MEFYGIPLKIPLKNLLKIPWNSVEYNEIQWNSWNFPWKSVEKFVKKIRQMFMRNSTEFLGKFYGIQWNYMELEFHKTEVDGIPWNSMEFHEFHGKFHGMEFREFTEFDGIRFGQGAYGSLDPINKTF
jgi:hypothetical protein